MTAGAYLMHRGWMDNPVFKPEPFTEREAWIWLIENARYEPGRVRVGSAVLELQRGQLAAAGRFLAQKWLWDEAKVRRYFSKLKTDAMIDADSDAGVTRLTIRNYDAYQVLRRSGEAANDAEIDATLTQDRRSSDAKKKEGNKGKKEKRGARATRLPDDFKVPAEWYPRAAEYRAAANLPPVDLAIEAIKFVNHFLSANGDKCLKTDWRRTWDNWVLNARAPVASLFSPKSGDVVTAMPTPLDNAESWRRAVDFFKRTGKWTKPGAKPGERNCNCPPAILAEFGYALEAA
jgi:hypothetical protein